MKWRPKVSILTLMLGSLLAGSGIGLYLHWEPWYCAFSVGVGIEKEKAVFSGDGRRLLAIVDDDKLKLIDTVTGQISTPDPRPYDDAKTMALNFDGTLAAVWRQGKRGPAEKFFRFSELWLLDTTGGHEPRKLPTVQNHPARPPYFSANGRLLVAPPNIFDVVSGEPVFTLGYVEKVEEPSEDEREFARSARTLAEFAAATKRISVRAVADPSGRYLLTQIGNEARHQLWDLGTLRKCTEPLMPKTDTSKVVFTESGEMLIERLENGFRMMNPRSGEELGIISFVYFRKFEFNRNGRRALACENSSFGDNYFRIQDTLPPQRETFSFRGSAAISPDGRFVAVSPGRRLMVKRSGAAKVAAPLQSNYLNDANTGKLIYELSMPQAGYVVCFGPDSETLLAATDKVTHFWKRRRPEHWAGVFTLVEFWMASLFLVLVGWSVRRDWRYFRGEK